MEKTSRSKVYVLDDPEELLARWNERRRKDAGEVDWDIEETKRKLLAFFGGKREEPGSSGPVGSGETGG